MSHKTAQMTMVRKKGSEQIDKGWRRTIYDMSRDGTKTTDIAIFLKMNYRTVYAIMEREKRKKQVAVCRRKRKLCAGSLRRIRRQLHY